MKLVGSGEQQLQHFMYDASGATASITVPQVILPVQPSRSSLLLQNLSAAPMFVQIGSALATATVVGGVVTAVTVTNAGFGFSKPPVIRFFGGGTMNNSSYVGRGAPGAISPSNIAKAHAVMAGVVPNQTVASIVIDNPGSGYVIAPFVFIENSDLDPWGCADPSLGTGNGIYLTPTGGALHINGTTCPTDAVAIFCATLASKFTCKFMT
jgi:hypothetical protein